MMLGFSALTAWGAAHWLEMVTTTRQGHHLCLFCAKLPWEGGCVCHISSIFVTNIYTILWRHHTTHTRLVAVKPVVQLFQQTNSLECHPIPSSIHHATTMPPHTMRAPKSTSHGTVKALGVRPATPLVPISASHLPVVPAPRRRTTRSILVARAVSESQEAAEATSLSTTLSNVCWCLPL